VQQYPRRAVVRRKEHLADTVATQVGIFKQLLQNLKVACHDYVALSKNPKANNRILVEPGRIPRFVIAKVPFRGIKEPLIFVLLLILSGHPIQERLNRRKTQENVATSTMVCSRVRDRDSCDGVLNEFEENPISPLSHAITVGNCINAV
jgi:hypothetical protein